MTDPNVVEDLLAHQEEASSQNRLLALEKKVQLQADEILCLKSSLADVIRRLQTVEAQHHADSKSKSVQKQSSTVSKQPPPSPRQSLTSRQSNSNSNLVENGGSSSSSKPISSRSNPKLSITSLKAVGGGQIQGTRGGASSAESSNGGHHGSLPQFLKDQGIIKLYLRGRPINFYLPNELPLDFDPHAVVKPPKDLTLKLEWVYGYRGKDCRSNIYQLQTGESVYFVAAVAILFNSEERSQRHYLGHTDDIKSIAVHPDRIRVATGQCTGHDKQEGRAHVRIWDSVTLVTLKTLGLSHSDLFQNSICCLSFSRTDNGEHLACVDEAGERILSVWRWETETRVAHAKSYGDAVLCLDWHPSEPSTLITAGKQHLIVWTFDTTSNQLSRKMATVEPVAAEKPKFVLSLVFNTHTGELISGDSDGNLILWSTKEAKAHRLIPGAHEGGVFSLLVVDDGKKVITGGKDFRLVEWDSVSWEKTGRVLELPDNHGSCRCLAPDQGNFFLVGTTKNSIYKANFDLHYIESVVQGHSDELWGLCTAPLAAATSTSFITCGNDSVLSVWDTLSHSRVQAQSVPDKLHCVHSHPIVENLVAVGCQSNKPKWFVYDLAERKTVFSQVETGQESVECIQYSPDGKYLAAGCRDNHIYVYQVTEHGQKYSRVGKCSGHSSFVTHLDWSTNSEYLMSNSGDYEILYWHVSPSGVGVKQATNYQVIRDLEWQNIGGCTLAPTVLGIWTGHGSASASASASASSSQSMDGTDINAVAVSKLRSLCAYVDDFGKVNLTSYPCAGFKVEKITYRGHSSHVTNVHFVNNDTRLVTTGGNDMSIFQWAIVTP